jgi:photosystem II stability/assembly factor-like uncharacterized protein
VEIPEERRFGGRARRAVPVIAVALATILVAAAVYLRPNLESGASTQLQVRDPIVATVEGSYQVTYDFVTPALGWAAVARTDATRVAYWVFVTSDATKHWRPQIAGTTEENDASVDLHFFDRRNGYVVIGRASGFATADAGAHWRRISFPARIAIQLAFADPSHGWFAGSDRIESGKGGPFPFYSTSDGGASWTLLPTPPGGGFAFRTASEGWAALGTQSGGTIYSTDDGGFTWVAHTLPEERLVEGMGIGDTEVRVLPGRGVVATAGTLAFTSFDAGRSWRTIALPQDASFSELAFQDSTHWWAMPSGNLLKTSDAGQTWQHVSLQFDDWQYRVQIVDARHAWARLDLSIGTQDPTRGTGLAVTTDGGVHWDYANVPGLPS